MIAPFTLQRIRALPIEEVARRLGLKVRGHRSLCPFHDDSRPSLTFNVRRNMYRCFVCNAHGGPIDLAMQLLNLPFAQAVSRLASTFGIYLPEEEGYRRDSAPAFHRPLRQSFVQRANRNKEGHRLLQQDATQRETAAHQENKEGTNVKPLHPLVGNASAESRTAVAGNGAFEENVSFEGNSPLAGNDSFAGNGSFEGNGSVEGKGAFEGNRPLAGNGACEGSGFFTGSSYSPKAGAYKAKKASFSTEYQVDVKHLERLVSPPLLNEEARHFLFDERKIHPEVVSWLGISSISSPVPMSRDYRSSWFNAPSLLIPYREVDGRLISVQARYLGPKSKEKGVTRYSPPRFQFPKGSHCRVFNLPVLRLLRPGDQLWITEGVSDCMAVLSSGRKAIAIPSATLLKEDDVQLLNQLHHRLGISFHICPDQDAAGARLYLDLRERLPNLTHHLLPPDYKDFGQWWAERKI